MSDMSLRDDDLAPPDGPPDLTVYPCRAGNCAAPGEFVWRLEGLAYAAAVTAGCYPTINRAPTPGAAFADGLAALRQVRP